MDSNITITLNQDTPTKEIHMNENINDVENNEAFKQLLASGESVIQTCRQLIEENARLRKMVEQRNEIMNVLTRHFNDAELGDICSSLDGKLTLLGCFEDTIDKFKIEDVDHLHSSLQALEAYAKTADEKYTDYQTLKDFKGEMDAIHEEFDIPKDVSALRDVLSDWKEMKEACDNHLIEYADLDSTLEEKEQYDNVLSDYNITDASELEDTITDMEDAKAYEKGFNELAEFVEKIKEVVGHCGDDIPATDMEDYK